MNRLLYLLPIIIFIGVANAGSVSLTMPSQTAYGNQITVIANQSFSPTDTIAIYVNGTQVAEAQNTTSYTFFAGSSSYYSAGLYNITAIDLNQTTDNSTTEDLAINQATPTISIQSSPALNQFYTSPTSFDLVYSISTYDNQLNASLYINQVLIANTSTSNSYTQVATGDYAVVLNTTGNQNYTNNTLTNYIYVNSPTAGAFTTTTTYTTSSSSTTTIPNNINSLNSNAFPSVYSAGLIIYLNPAGYFEYVLSNSTSYKLNTDFYSSNLYENTAPDMYTATPLNATNLIQNTSNYNYEGAIFYTPIIDISPLEDCILGISGCSNPSGGNANGLTPNGLFTFLSQTPIAYNTTVVYSTPPTLASFLVKSFTDGFDVAGTAVAPFLSSFLLPSISNPLSSNNFEYISPQQNAIAALATKYNSNPLAVYFDANALGLGTLSSKPNSQTALYEFDNYYNNIYQPNADEDTFIFSNLAVILGYTILIYILIKINGD